LLAKAEYKRDSTEYLASASASLVQASGSDRVSPLEATKNLWNLKKLGYMESSVVGALCQVINDNDPEDLSQLDVANAVTALAAYHNRIGQVEY